LEGGEVVHTRAAVIEEWKVFETVKYKNWGTDKYTNKHGVQKERPMLLSNNVPVQEFIEYACTQLATYADHVTTLRRQSFAGQQLVHNMQPHMVLCDVDFSENMDFRVRDASQATHWQGLGSATLFICVARLLCLNAWKELSSVLKEGD
jgi:hypothetical protein